MQSPLEAALSYVARGWAVFPVYHPSDTRDTSPPGKRGKIPIGFLVPHGLKDATTDPRVVRDWWNRVPDANIGISCGMSDLCVCDIDSAEGEAALESCGELPETLEAKTSKGRHLYMRGTSQSNNGILPRVDRKSLGGYVVAPPSVHESGHVYEFSDPDVPVAPAPSWFLELRPAAREDVSGEGKLYEEPVFDEGKRNSGLLSVAGKAWRAGMDADALLTHLSTVNQKRCLPPLPEDEVRSVWQSVTGRYAKGDDDSPEIVGTDLWMARRIAADYSRHLKYVPAWGKWVIYSETDARWVDDTTNAAQRHALMAVNKLTSEVLALNPDNENRGKLWKALTYFQSARGLGNALKVATALPEMIAAHDEWDADPWALNCSNGVVDLRTGALRQHRPEDKFRKTTGLDYDPSAKCDLWLSFLEQILPDASVRDFMQRALGYAAIGKVLEHILVICYGEGSNGKSVMLNTASFALGDYACAVPTALLVYSKFPQHDTIKADLHGKRLAVASEPADGSRFDEAQVKLLTGGDRIKARRMREDFWEFEPSHTLFLLTNHKLNVRDDSAGFWRRVCMIPFTVFIAAAQRDKALPDKLRAEAPGILRWLVEGAVSYCASGLPVPPVIEKETEKYRDEENPLAEFFATYEVSANDFLTPARAHADLVEFSKKGNTRLFAPKALSIRMNRHFAEARKTLHGKDGWGLRQKSASETSWLEERADANA